jgi:glycosyltransferase involved in cell wall biosynthesis
MTMSLSRCSRDCAARRRTQLSVRSKHARRCQLGARRTGAPGKMCAVRRVLHILPHRGGGGETYIDLLMGLDGYAHARAPLSAGRTPASAAASLPLRWPRLLRAARDADIVHSHGDVASTLVLALPHGRPLVVTTHGLHFLRRATGVRLAVAQRSMRAVAGRAARVLCTSQAEHDELAELLGAALAPRLVVARNGVAASMPRDGEQRAAIRAQLGLADGDVTALFLGELSARKAPLLAAEAARRAGSDGAPIVLLVAGDGPQAGELHAQASAAVRPLGFRDDSARLLAAADVFVLPSSREGLSFAVLEAMANGLAIVVADGPGNPEAVGDAGVVVAAGDVDAFASALRRLAQDRGERERLGAAARERARSVFSIERMLGAVAAAYADALR